MADYYPLIARAVAGLEKNSGENRRALYERARAALLAQLRSVEPALNESDITRERLALEESIRKVEAEAARKFIETPSRPVAAPRIRPVASRPAEPVEEQSAPARRYVNPPAPGQGAQQARQEPAARARPTTPSAARPIPTSPPAPKPLPAPKPPPQAPRAAPRREEPRSEEPRSEQPRSEQPLQSGAMQLRHPLRRPTADRASPGDGKEPRNFDSDEPGAPLARADRSPRNSYAPPIVDLDRSPRARERDRVQDHDRDARERAPDTLPFDRPEMLDSKAAPEPTHDPRHEQYDSYARNDFSEPMLESAFPVGDAEPGFAKPRPTAPVSDDADLYQPVAKAREWLSWRPSRELIRSLGAAVVGLALVGVLAWQWGNMVELYRSMRAPAVETAREAPPSTARQKITDRIEPGSQSSTAAAPPVQPAAAVAQKVVLYEEDPADPSGKRFVGSAVWRTETVTPGPGLPPELAIRADVEVPERKIAMTWSLRRNTDKSLPASHTVEIVFKLPTDFPAGGISNVPGILMKQAEQTRGVPLSGLAVKVTNGFFLIGLSSVDADKERNLQLLKDRAWFDIPVVYNNNRRAILAMEKGTPGERAFAEAFKVWKQ
jgi:hypothetical protein